jgi:aspartyl-tRNA(Asn)/glutamyl-tRNA(Gln) amidotransferase subunit A
MANALNKLTLKEAQKKLQAREITAVQLVGACLSAIKEKDPTIRAFITITEDSALERAAKIDAQVNDHGPSVFKEKPLLGIPYAAKDNFSTKGILTTSSSKMLDNYYPPFDATVIERLNDAGAILVGKTNMDAFAHGGSTEASDFFTTKNPWDTNKLPGGSSGGSAAAVMADMCIFAVGSETGGSIRCPASWCGITGYKPSYGRVSRYGITAMASSTDSPGPMTKTVEDAAIVLQVIAGKDPNDATSSSAPVPVYADLLEAFSLEGLKIGKPRSYFTEDVEDGVIKKLEESFSILEKAGATIVDMDILDPKYGLAVYTVLQRSEVSSNLGRLDGIRYGNPRDHFGFEAKKRIMLGTYSLSAGYYDEFYGKAQKVRTLIIEDYNRAFEEVDLIAGPTLPCVAMDIGATDSSPLWGELIDRLNEPSCIAGLPGITINAGFSNGLPVGMQFVGRMLEDARVLAAAHKFQEVTSFHKERP